MERDSSCGSIITTVSFDVVVAAAVGVTWSSSPAAVPAVAVLVLVAIETPLVPPPALAFVLTACLPRLVGGAPPPLLVLFRFAPAMVKV